MMFGNEWSRARLVRSKSWRTNKTARAILSVAFQSTQPHIFRRIRDCAGPVRSHGSLRRPDWRWRRCIARADAGNGQAVLGRDDPWAREGLRLLAALRRCLGTPHQSAWLHVWVGEYELGANEQPVRALWHFRQAQKSCGRGEQCGTS